VLDPVWLLLLLPLAAASGWLAARADQRKRAVRQAGDIPSAYFKGLNFLLNEQPDKAIEVFIKVLEVDTETVETHLMLGSLFRRRGEIERATRIHQNLIARPNLDREQRSQALYELAQDYLKAGLLDRAENLLLEYAEVEHASEPALRQLLYIYQQEKEWEQAITTARRLVRVTGEPADEMIAHFYCEQAEDAIAKGENKQAETLLKQALAIDSGSVRANILRGDLLQKRDNCKAAIDFWLRTAQQDRDYFPEVLERLSRCYSALDDADGWEQMVRRSLAERPSIPLMIKLTEIIETRHGSDAARQFITEQLREHPSLHGLVYLLRLSAEQASGQAQQDLQTLQSMIEGVISSRKSHVCQNCGFRGKALHWQCPGCKRWNTIKPVLDASHE
jgi:lipopolysaccharide biosynthesis regulator YciM